MPSYPSSAPAASFQNADGEEQEESRHAQEKDNVNDTENAIGKIRIVAQEIDFSQYKLDPVHGDQADKVTHGVDNQTCRHADDSSHHHALGQRRKKDVDRDLYEKENVISSDSIILDRCLSWINLAALCMERQNRQGLRVWDDLKEQVDE